VSESPICSRRVGRDLDGRGPLPRRSAGGSAYHDAAWSYSHLYPATVDRVGKDYSGYVAFDKRQVTFSG
jgi:hypothetical protein